MYFLFCAFSYPECYTTVNRILILGIGSPFGDDKVGWLVVSRLEQNPTIAKLVKNGCLQLEVVDRPGISLINWLLGGYHKIILVDMVKTNLHIPGQIYNLNADEIIGFSGMLSSHSLGVSASLALARELAIPIENVNFWGIEGVYTTPDAGIHPEVADSVKIVSQQIADILQGLFC